MPIDLFPDYEKFCFHCGDTNVHESWERIGGSIGQLHYVCHRKRCQRKQQKIIEARRAQAAERRKRKEQIAG